MLTASASSTPELGPGGGLRLGPGGGHRDEDRATHDLQPLALAEHVLGPAQADALRAIAASLGGFLGLVGVRPDLHPADLVGPAQDPLELRLVLEPGFDGRQCADVQRTARSIETDPVTLLELRPGDVAVRLGAGVVDHQVRRTRHAWLADLARDDGRVGGGSASGGDDPLGHGHAVEVIRRGLDPDEDHLFAAVDPFDGGVGVEHRAPDGGPR